MCIYCYTVLSNFILIVHRLVIQSTSNTSLYVVTLNKLMLANNISHYTLVLKSLHTLVELFIWTFFQAYFFTLGGCLHNTSFPRKCCSPVLSIFSSCQQNTFTKVHAFVHQMVLWTKKGRKQEEEESVSFTDIMAKTLNKTLDWPRSSWLTWQSWWPSCGWILGSGALFSKFNIFFLQVMLI